jgi:PAS domain S-box-containing protein
MEKAESIPDRTSQFASDSLEQLYRLAGRNFGSSMEATSAVLSTISDVLGMRTSWVSHADFESCELEIVAAYNEPGGCDVQPNSSAPLPETFCTLAMRAASAVPLVIEDVRNDPDFARSVAASSFPNIGSYIGVPIVLSDGEIYGTLCASDPAPHRISANQAKLLSVLSRMMATQIERDNEIDSRKSIEQRFHAFMDHSPLVAYMKDPEGRYVYTNGPFERAFGVKRNWLIGRTDCDWLDPNTAEKVRENDEQILALQRSQQFVEAVPQEDGTNRYYYSYKFPIVDANGQSFVGGASADITERREREIERSYLAAIVKDSSDAIYGRDLDGIVTSWNPSAERLFGYRASEMMGKSLDVLVPPSYPNDQPMLRDRLRRGEHILQYETQRQTKSGRVLDVQLSLSPIRDSDGVIVGASTIARDITERNLLLAERDRLFAELQEEVARAAAVQASLLPRTVPQFSGYEFAATCLPAREVGGDFFDWVGTGDTVRLTLGDVSGKGMPAALLMATARSALRAALRLPVEMAVDAVNQALHPDLEQSDAFVTMVHAELDQDGGVTLIDAGHGMSLIVRADGTITTLSRGHIPLGILPEISYPTCHAQLDPGDTLIMYSDGLADARPDLRLEEPANLGALCEPASDAIQTLERLVSEANVHRLLPDDLTIILVHRQGPRP